MSTQFEVEIHPIKKQHTDVCDKENTECNKHHYQARWIGGQYIADNITCHILAVRPSDNWCKYGEYDYGPSQYEDTFTCRSRTLDACICEAEMILKDCLFGKAELLDGKYRVATVTKKADDEYTNSGLTRYGEKCKKSEPESESTLSCAGSKSVLMSIDAFNAYYDEY